MSSDGLATATQAGITINVNVDHAELQRRMENQQIDGFAETYYQVFPSVQDQGDNDLVKGELAYARRGAPPGESGRLNIISSFCGASIVQSKLQTQPSRAGYEPLSIEERAREMLEKEWIFVGVVSKNVTVNYRSPYVNDPPVVALSGTYDMLNMGTGYIHAMDILVARIPTMKERFRLPGGGGDVKGYSKNKWTGIVVPFDPTCVQPLITTYQRYFAIQSVAAAKEVSPGEKRKPTEINDAADCFANQNRYMFMMGAILANNGAFAAFNTPGDYEKAVGLAPYHLSEGGKYVTSAHGAWDFLAEYRGMPVSKAVMMLALGLSKPLSKGLVAQHLRDNVSHATRCLTMNVGSDSIASQNERVSTIQKSIVGQALTSAAPGRSFEIEVRALLS